MSTDVEAPPRRDGARRQLLIWGIILGTIGAIVAMIAATGGFATGAEPYKGKRISPGEEVSTRFWDVAVHSAEFELPEGYRGELRISMTITNLLKEATYSPTANMFIVRVPGTEYVMDRSYCTPAVGREFQPLIASEAICRFSFQENDVADPPAGEPFAFQLVILDQNIYVAYVEGSRPQAAGPAAWLELSAPQFVKKDE